MAEYINRNLENLPPIGLDPCTRPEDLQPILPTVDPAYYQSTLSKQPLRESFDLLEEEKIERPELDPPTAYKPSCTLLMALESFARFQELQGRNIEVFSQEIDLDIKQVEQLEKKHAAIIKEASLQERSLSTWSTLSEIASYLTSSTALILGIAAWEPGSFFAAGALIASAGLGITNQIIRSTIGWNTVARYFSSVQETQRKIEQCIEIGFIATSTILGLAGALTQVGQIAELVQNSSAKILQTGLFLVSGAANLGKSHLEGKYTKLNAKQVLHRQRTQAKQMDIQLKSDDVGEDIKRLELGNQLSQIISQQHQLMAK